ncbi:MAG: glycosyltransferase family 2 protein, partial [Nanoarchaeota archaeon]|nr:glycosyltransferase family 2 protein [Nanoarchaeota archaeon]
LVIVFPAYNEEKTIAFVVKDTPKNIDGIGQIQCLVINDGSTDKTEVMALQAGALVVSHDRNKGLGRTFKTGVEEALKMEADIMVNIDGDGQFNPRDIPKLIKPIIENRVDFVTASRFIDKNRLPQNMSRTKIWGNKKVSWLISWLARRKFYDVSCGFRAYNREALLSLNLFGDFTYTQETFLDLSFKGLRIEEVPVEVTYFKERESRVAKNLFIYAWQILKIIFKTFRDYQPLRFFGGLGGLIFVVGLILDVFILVHYLNMGGFTPFKSYAFVGGFLNLTGLGLFILGLVTDMLNRIRINQEKLLFYAKKKYYERR